MMEPPPCIGRKYKRYVAPLPGPGELAWFLALRSWNANRPSRAWCVLRLLTGAFYNGQAHTGPFFDKCGRRCGKGIREHSKMRRNAPELRDI